ncbi:hypothetical protein Taro_044518 [Colocasia esculenta]|uniref:Uncharacterized protein n=1 Tax=Colocasia esculenta TaxID=4460 RepID=A0A843X5J7_COLES|nr:hypothetical protein [Colocasia esculenta]
MVDEWKLLEDFTKLNIDADIKEMGCLVASARAQPTLLEDITTLQDNDPGLVEEHLVAEELWNDHKKLIFFPFSSAATCTNLPLKIDQRLN